MLDLLFNPEHFNMAFTAALSIATLFIAIELIGMIIGGFSLQNINDFELPDIPGMSFFDINSPNEDKRTPSSMIIFSFLLCYAAIGLIVNSATNFVFSGVLFSIAMILPALLLNKYIGKAIGKIIPSLESDVVSLNSFIGEECEIIVGTATLTRAAQARYKDPFGTVHTFMIQPIHDTPVKAGEKMTITAFNKDKDGFFFGYKSTEN